MARRKKKEADFINFILIVPPLLVSYLVFLVSKNFIGSFIVFSFVFAVMIGILIYRKLSWNEKLKKSGIVDIDKMDGRQFEHYLGVLFKNHGYLVKVTQAAGDYGADLVISKDGKKIVVQAKRYSKNVSLKAVQEAAASIAYYGATAAWVVTNSEFTEAAINLARSNNVRLLGRRELVEMISMISPTTVPDPKKVIAEVAATKEDTCVKCGSPMVHRKGPRGDFLGCSAFPRCRTTKQIT